MLWSWGPVARRLERTAQPSTASRWSRMSRPVAGFGVNSVDLRGIRSPAAATAATASTGVGLSRTAVPAVRLGSGEGVGHVVLVADVVDVVGQSPQRRDHQRVQHAHVERRPGGRPLRRHGGGEPVGVGLAEQVQLLGVARRQQEGRAGAAGVLQRGQCVDEVAVQAPHPHALCGTLQPARRAARRAPRGGWGAPRGRTPSRRRGSTGRSPTVPARRRPRARRPGAAGRWRTCGARRRSAPGGGAGLRRSPPAPPGRSAPTPGGAGRRTAWRRPAAARRRQPPPRPPPRPRHRRRRRPGRWVRGRRPRRCTAPDGHPRPGRWCSRAARRCRPPPASGPARPPGPAARARTQPPARTRTAPARCRARARPRSATAPGSPPPARTCSWEASGSSRGRIRRTTLCSLAASSAATLSSSMTS